MSHQLTFLEILAADITMKRSKARACLYVTCWFREKKKKFRSEALFPVLGAQ